jgi:peptide/nickel transport system ATP-binding protein
MSRRGPVLEVRDLGVEFAVRNGQLHAVQGISFDIMRGETLAIVGESGCGKSATSLALMGLLPGAATMSARKLAFQDIDLLAISGRDYANLRGNKIAMIFQEPMTALNPILSIGEQLSEPLRRHRKASRREALMRAEELLERVGVPEPAVRVRQYPHELSGGMRQRVVIAMALMCGPDLLIADEPTTALDVSIQGQILALLEELCREFEMGMLLITHDLGVVRKSATRTAVMYAGKIIEMGATRDILEKPLHPYTSGLLASLPGRAPPGSLLETIPGLVPSLMEASDMCAFADRCPAEFAKCRQSAVALKAVGNGREYRCHLPGHEQ